MRNQPLLYSLLLIAAATRCHAQVSDPCPTERADFTDNAALSSGEMLAATLDDKKLGTLNIFEFSAEAALALSISTENSSPIASLLVGVSRSDEDTSSASVPCDSLASGVTFEPNTPQASVTAFISVEDSNSHLVLDVTIVLEDGTFLYGIYSVEFVDTIFRFPSPSPPKSPMPVTVVRVNRQNDGDSGSGKGHLHSKGRGKGHGKGKGKAKGTSAENRSESEKGISEKSASGKSSSDKNTSSKGLSSISMSSRKGTSLGKGHSTRV